jgi:SAM-dependent methyltransferase
VVFRENLIGGDAATELYQDDGYLDTPYFEALKVGHRRDVEPYLVYGRVLNRLERLTPGRRLLDVGCSYGAFLELARERGWEVTGVDLSAKAAAYATAQRGLPVFTGTLEAAAYPARTFSAVTMWDVIEHLDDPRGLLREVHRVLAPGGVLVVFTINQGSLINRTGHLLHRLSRGALTRPLVLLYDIHHNFFFDRRTLAQVIHGAGFWGIQRDHLGANIERWQNVPIPRLLALGSKCLDAAAWVTGQHYRVIAYAFK